MATGCLDWSALAVLLLSIIFAAARRSDSDEEEDVVQATDIATKMQEEYNAKLCVCVPFGAWRCIARICILLAAIARLIQVRFFGFCAVC